MRVQRGAQQGEAPLRRALPPAPNPRTASEAAVLGLQRTAGNNATTAALAVQREDEGGLLDTIADLAADVVSAIAGVPSWALDLLGSGPVDAAALRMLHKAGVSEEDLTDLVFQLKHPEAAGRKLGKGDGALKADWKQIRKWVRKVVKPPKEEVLPTGPISSDKLGAFGSEAPTAFRETVYEKQLARAEKEGDFFAGVQGSDLEEVENGKYLHKDAASDARDLLAAARADLATQKAAGDPAAKKVTSISVKSAYRSVKKDFSAWKTAFTNNYAKTEDERKALPGGAFGDAAIDLMVSKMVTLKAVPGFSNHTRGLAIDFGTVDKGNSLGASASENGLWKDSWLFAWLEANAATHGFQPYAKERWHWDHLPPP